LLLRADFFYKHMLRRLYKRNVIPITQNFVPICWLCHFIFPSIKTRSHRRCFMSIIREKIITRSCGRLQARKDARTNSVSARRASSHSSTFISAYIYISLASLASLDDACYIGDISLLFFSGSQPAPSKSARSRAL